MSIPTKENDDFKVIQFYGTDGIDFVRDVLAFMCVVAAIIAVAFDGKVNVCYVVIAAVAKVYGLCRCISLRLACYHSST